MQPIVTWNECQTIGEWLLGYNRSPTTSTGRSWKGNLWLDRCTTCENDSSLDVNDRLYVLFLHSKPVVLLIRSSDVVSLRFFRGSAGFHLRLECRDVRHWRTRLSVPFSTCHVHGSMVPSDPQSRHKDPPGRLAFPFAFTCWWLHWNDPKHAFYDLPRVFTAPRAPRCTCIAFSPVHSNGGGALLGDE